MSNYKISHRYALALLNISIEKNLLDRVSEDVEKIDKALVSSRELLLFFKSPVIKTDKKLRIFDEIFNNQISDVFSKFCHLLIKKGREAIIKDIIDEFYSLRDKHSGIVNIIVQSAYDFNESQIAKLQSVLEELTKKKVKLKITIEKSLKGGFIVQIDDTIFDASIKRQLELLHQKFLFGQEI